MPAVTLRCHTRFITNSEVREKETLTIADSTMTEEMELGFHKDSGNEEFKVPMYGKMVPLASVLNHCHVVKASTKMAKSYLGFMKEAGCTDDELDILGSKIEIFATAADLDEKGKDDNIIPKKKKKLTEMKESELQIVAQREGVKDWDKMNRSELMKEITRKRA